MRHQESREDLLDFNQALAWLKIAITLGNENLPWFKSNPAWQSLRSDERFEILIREIEQRHSNDDLQ